MADEMRFERRMSDSDALMWAIEKDPLLRSTIMAIAVLDRAPDPDRLTEKIDRGLRLIPRLRQKAVSAPLSAAPPRWVVDPNFDLRYHLRVVRAAGDGSLRSLLDLAQPLAMQGFDRARPLWEFTVVEGLSDGRAALIQKVHHSVTDGVGGIKLAMMLLDLERDPGPSDELLPDLDEPEDVGWLALWRDAMAHERRRNVGIALRSASTMGRAAASAAADPSGTTRRAAATAGSVAKMLTPVFEPMSPIMRGRSLSVHFDTLAVPMEELKAAARSVDGSLNDAFVAAVTGGLRLYHERHGESVEQLRMTMPINIRTGPDEGLAGNQFTPARFAVPISIADPKERLGALRDLVRSERAEPALALTSALAGVLNRLPTSLTTQLFGSMLKGIDFVTSNVPGAPIPVYLAGARLEANFAFGPLSGSAANLTLLSYLDEVHVGINTDQAAVPDPEVFRECLEEGFDEVRKLC